jgi:hypothetical protein
MTAPDRSRRLQQDCARGAWLHERGRLPPGCSDRAARVPRARQRADVGIDVRGFRSLKRSRYVAAATGCATRKDTRRRLWQVPARTGAVRQAPPCPNGRGIGSIPVVGWGERSSVVDVAVGRPWLQVGAPPLLTTSISVVTLYATCAECHRGSTTTSAGAPPSPRQLHAERGAEILRICHRALRTRRSPCQHRVDVRSVSTVPTCCGCHGSRFHRLTYISSGDARLL